MASPFDQELIKSGIDEVKKVQAERGKIRVGRLAPTINHREGYYAIQRNTGFRDARSYSRGEPIEQDVKTKLELQHIYPLIFAKSWTTYLYDPHEDVYNEMADNIADAGLAMIRRKDKEEMNLLNNGFSSSYLIVDGQPLFSTAHTGATGVTGQANRPTTGSSLDVTSVEEMLTRLMGQEDFNGESMYFDTDINIWVGVTLWPLLWRIVEAEMQAGGADNDPNYVGTRVRAMMSHQISSTAAFYGVAADSSQHHLRMIQFSPYNVFTREAGHALDVDHYVWERYRAVAEDWHGTDANPGP
jgi:hypothetical protein